MYMNFCYCDICSLKRRRGVLEGQWGTSILWSWPDETAWLELLHPDSRDESRERPISSSVRPCFSEKRRWCWKDSNCRGRSRVNEVDLVPPWFGKEFGRCDWSVMVKSSSPPQTGSSRGVRNSNRGKIFMW